MYTRIVIFFLPFFLSCNFLSARQIAFDAVFETCQKFLHYLRHQNEEDAYFCTTTYKYKEAVSWDAFRQFVRSNPSLHSSEKLLVGNVSQNRDIASLEGMILDTKGNALYILFELEKESRGFGINKVSLMQPAYSFHLIPNGS